VNKYAIIVAGGSGTRMQSDIPKQFMLLNGKPVLYYAINSFLKTFKDCTIVLVLPEEHIGTGQEIIDAFFDYKKIKIVQGGRTRFHSVQNGLAQVQNEDCIIFVHDAVRPVLSEILLKRCYACAVELGSAIPSIAVNDSMRQLIENGNEAVNRNDFVLIQTPQTFHSKILLPAFKIDYKDKFTDEASVVEAFGLRVSLIEGEEQNIKITKASDLILAEAFIKFSVL
jgi:2-C-methyl-D-erythritol 4-phosphate cytidylyltransferase